ncbi:basic amino acid ABC transporter substrate-binding protein [Butyrivibrio sp. YAB3001]|uniref:basic amino acid ABC transporter substrate-binding protein n=1 Tax=Butyrivibrio sp. YAB3001 TaxID=1520812 RepID=UPI0008F63B6B|nr:basic amino acid ABC transporter substrate-binding protein [Butyrivibrio sp. YAB3001]SFB68146.1 polar amino acid transport system substrate-binding protein [Butyrivibrio sp. YAB3001]
MKKKIFALLLTTMLTVSSLAGCGSSSSDGTKGANGTLKVGTNAAFPPFEYVGDDGNPDGFDIALINAIGEKLNMDVQVQDMEFESLCTSIGNKIDVAIAGMTITEERLNTVDFSDSYYEAVQAVLVPKGSTIATADDLKNLKIGAQLGTTGEFIASDIEGATVSAYNKAVDAVNDLNNGRLDCVIVDKNPAEVFGSQFSDKLDVIDGTAFDFEPEFYAIALPKGNTDLATKINDALKELKNDGTYDSLVKKYIEE